MDFVPGLEDPEDSLPFPDVEDSIVFDLPEEVEDPKDEIARRIADQQARIDAQAAQLAALQERQLQVPTQQAPTIQYVPQQQVAAPQPVDKSALIAKFYEDPIGMMAQISEIAKNQAIDEMKRSLIPVQGAAARNAILSYRQSSGMPKEVAKEFDELLKGADLSKADPNAIQEQIQAVEMMAYGRALKNGSYVPTSSGPINLGGGSGRGSASVSKGKVRVDVTPRQAANIKIAREVWGLDDKTIQANLKAGEYD